MVHVPDFLNLVSCILRFYNFFSYPFGDALRMNTSGGVQLTAMVSRGESW